MHLSIEIFAAIQLMIIGFSHVLQAHAWVDFFVWLRERGTTGIFLHGFLSLWFGSLIVGFHNTWTGMASILTVVGYLYLLKACMCLLLPMTQVLSLSRVSHERAGEMRMAGAVYIVIASLLTYAIWMGHS